MTSPAFEVDAVMLVELAVLALIAPESVRAAATEGDAVMTPETV